MQGDTTKDETGVLQDTRSTEGLQNASRTEGLQNASRTIVDDDEDMFATSSPEPDYIHLQQSQTMVKAFTLVCMCLFGWCVSVCVLTHLLSSLF